MPTYKVTSPNPITSQVKYLKRTIIIFPTTMQLIPPPDSPFRKKMIAMIDSYETKQVLKKRAKKHDCHSR